MKEKFINSGIKFISKYETCDDLKLIKLKYGLEGIFNLIIKLSVVLLISIITKTIISTLIFLLFYTGIRTYSFGWHAKSSLGCWISTIIVYNIIPLLSKNLTIPAYFSYAILGISFISMLLWAPADTPKRPLIHPEKRRKAKIISLCIVTVYAIIYFFFNNNLIRYNLIYALLIQSILVNPITYFITKTRFNNYKNYQSTSQ